MDALSALNSFCAESDAPVVAIINSPKYEAMLLHVAPRLMDRGLQPVAVSVATPTPDIEDELFPGYRLAPDELRQMRDVAVVLSMDVLHTYPRESRVVFIPHAFCWVDPAGEPTASAFAWYDIIPLFADALFLPHPMSSKISADEYQSVFGGIYPSALAGRSGKFSIIPGGY